jgi:hypothetical protein
MPGNYWPNARAAVAHRVMFLNSVLTGSPCRTKFEDFFTAFSSSGQNIGRPAVALIKNGVHYLELSELGLSC